MVFAAAGYTNPLRLTVVPERNFLNTISENQFCVLTFGFTSLIRYQLTVERCKTCTTSRIQGELQRFRENMVLIR